MHLAVFCLLLCISICYPKPGVSTKHRCANFSIIVFDSITGFGLHNTDQNTAMLMRPKTDNQAKESQSKRASKMKVHFI